MKNFFYIFAMVLLLCSCGNGSECDSPELDGDYLFTFRWDKYENDVLTETRIVRLDSIFVYRNNELVHEQENYYNINTRLLRVYHDGEDQFIRNTLIGIPDTSNFIEHYEGKFAPERMKSPSFMRVYFENGIVLCVQNGIRFFYSLPIRVNNRTANSLVLENIPPFDVDVFNLDDECIGFATLQYKFQPIVFQKDHFTWRAESNITFSPASIFQSMRMVFQMEGDRSHENIKE